MMRSGEEESQQRGNNYESYVRAVEEVQYQPLNLPLTISRELLDYVENIVKEQYPCPRQRKPAEKTKILVPPETPMKREEKPKPINFPFTEIKIGGWTRKAVYPEDLKAKIYFARKKLIWEILDEVSLGVRRKRKIAIQWSDISSLRRSYLKHNNTGRLEVELKKPPTFSIETDPKPGQHTKWKGSHDFTTNQDASAYRRHTLYFEAGVLQKIFEERLQSDMEWSRLINANNYPKSESLRFDVDNNFFQGFGHCPAGLGDGNVNMKTQYCGNHGTPMQNNTADLFFGMQASSQMIDSSWPQPHNPTIQYQSHMDNTNSLLANQAYAQGLLETQTNSIPHANEAALYSQVKWYMEEVLFHEQEKQNKEQIRHDFSEIDQYLNLDGPDEMIDSLWPQPHNPTIQYQSHMDNTNSLLANQAYAQGLLETQTNSIPHANEAALYAHVDWYMEEVLYHEEEKQNKEQIGHDFSEIDQYLNLDGPDEMIDSSWPQSHNPTIQYQGQMDNTNSLLADQASAQGLLETQTNSIPHAYEGALYAQVDEWYLEEFWDEEEKQNMEQIHHDFSEIDQYLNLDGPDE